MRYGEVVRIGMRRVSGICTLLISPIQARTSCLSPTRTSPPPCSARRAFPAGHVRTTPLLPALLLIMSVDYDSRRHEAGMSLDGLRDQALHAVRRRPWARGMNSASMKHYEELIHDTLSDLITALKQRTGKTVDMSEWTNYFGFDFMGRMA